MALDFIGEIAKAIPTVIGQFNTKDQRTRIAIAEAEARAAEANAAASNAKPKSNTIIWVVVICAILALAYFITQKK